MCYSASVTRQARVHRYQRRRGDPLKRRLKVYTLDSATQATNGSHATVEIPWEPLEPGPVGSLFRVETRDGNRELSALDLDDKILLTRGGLEPSFSDHCFHQQMVYAVASKVYVQFEAALGRQIAWGCDTPDGRLILRPHVQSQGKNATYQRDQNGISFGYYEAPPDGAGRSAPKGSVFTCLSHDIIAHELTHALLDGLRSRFMVPTSNDVLGFHEGFADLIAVFQHFTYKEILQTQIRSFKGRLDQSLVLADIAAHFGLTTRGGRALRTAQSCPSVYRSDMEPHEMGNLLVSAVFNAFLKVFERRVEPFVRLAYQPPSGYMTAELVDFLAQRAASMAEQFLGMCIRAIDYCPAVDMALGEYLRAIITVDRELIPEDPWGYRDAMITEFADRGIYPPGVQQLSEDALMWRPPDASLEPVHDLHFANLRFAGDPSLPAGEDELVRQAVSLWQYIVRPHVIERFGFVMPGVDGAEDPIVESIRTARRTGPDGQVLFDLVAEVTQRRQVADLGHGVGGKFYGASTIIIGPQGEFRYIITKSIKNQERMKRQAEYQRGSGFWLVQDGNYHMNGYSNQLVHEAR